MKKHHPGDLYRHLKASCEKRLPQTQNPIARFCQVTWLSCMGRAQWLAEFLHQELLWVPGTRILTSSHHHHHHSSSSSSSSSTLCWEWKDQQFAHLANLAKGANLALVAPLDTWCKARLARLPQRAPPNPKPRALIPTP